MNEQVSTLEPEVMSEADAMGAVWDKHQEDATADSLEQPQEAIDATPEAEPTGDRPRGPDGKFLAKETGEPVAAEEPVDAEPAEQEFSKTEAPGHLPYDVRKHWGDVPEEARDAYANAYKAMGDRLTDASRQTQYFKPILDTITRASKELPNLSGMTSQQIANDIFELAKIQTELAQNPVDTIIEVARQHGALEGLSAKLGGQEIPQNANQTQQLVQTIGQLQKQIEQMQDPSRVSHIIDQRLAEQEVSRAVEEFSAKAEHWGAVEEHLHHFLPLARSVLGQGAAKPDVLAKGYEMAINALGLKAPAGATPEPKPDRTNAAIQAKSVNVQNRQSGKQKPLTGKEALGAAYDRAMSN